MMVPLGSKWYVGILEYKSRFFEGRFSERATRHLEG